MPQHATKTSFGGPLGNPRNAGGMSSELRSLVDAARLEAAKGAVRDVKRLRKIARDPRKEDGPAVSAMKITLDVAGATKPEPTHTDAPSLREVIDFVREILKLKMPAAVEVLDAEFREVNRALPAHDPTT
jgi:hypothetical protein